MKELSIPLLTEQDIDCRVQSVSKAKTRASICESWTRSSGLATGREPTK